MTFKKSMISIAAASVIAAGLTGCGSSDSTPVVAGTTTTTTTTTSTAPSTFEAVDGKVMNAIATATYWDADANATATLVLDANTTYTELSNNTIVKGDYSYSIPADSNVTADMIRYVTFSKDTLRLLPGTTRMQAPTFIDLDASNDYNASVDLALTPTVLVATKGDAYASLASTIKFEAAGGAATYDAAELNTTVTDAAQAQVEAMFGLSAGQLATLDPTQDVEFNFLNAQFGSLTTAQLQAQAAVINDINLSAVDLSSVAKIVAYASETLAIPVFTAIVDNGLDLTDLAKYDADLVRDSGGLAVLETAAAGTIGSISNITVGTNDTNASLLTSTGDKIDNLDVTFTFAPNSDVDTNSSGTVDLVLELTNPTSAVEDTDVANTLLVKLSNVEVNKVEGTTSIDLNDTTSTVSYTWLNVTDANVSNTGYVASVIVSDANFTALSGLAASTLISGGNTLDLSALITAIDTNASTTADAAISTSFTGNIASIKAGIVDASGLLTKVDANTATANPVGWEPATVNGVSALPILNSVRYDMRSGVTTGVNVAPNNTITLGNKLADLNRTTYDLNATNNTAYDVNISAQTVNTNESNSTVEFTLGTGLSDANLTEVKRALKLSGVANVTGAIDMNASVDTFTTLTTKITDEFGESNTSINDIMINVKPLVNAEDNVTYNIPASTTDYNGTTVDTGLKITNIYDINKTIQLAFDANSTSDTNITNAWVEDGTLRITYANDANNTDVNLTILDPVSSDLNCTINVKGWDVSGN